MVQQPKIVLLGAGNIGGMLAFLSGLKKLGHVYLYDIIEHTAAGKALDLNHLNGIEHALTHFKGSAEDSIMEDADVVIVTAGLPRKPGMSREDLIVINGKIIKSIGQKIKTSCTKAFVVCITNPLDAMVYLLQQESGLPPERVVGMAGVLDSARFSHYLSEALNISAESIQTCVLGCHGDSMVILPRYTSINGIPLQDFIKKKLITEKEVQQLINRTRYAGQEVIDLLRTGSAFFAPAASAIHMIESYLKDKKTVLSCCAYLNGEYGIQDCYAGVPVVIGSNGVEKIIELDLLQEELQNFHNAVMQVKKLIQTYYNEETTSD